MKNTLENRESRMKEKGNFVVVTIPNDLYNFLNGYEFATNEDGTGLVFFRDELEKYNNMDYYEDDMPNENVIAQLDSLLKKHKNIDLFILI